MNLRWLETVLTVAECRGFSKAEEKTTYTQSAISKQIKAVENEFHLTIFNRENKTFSVTPEGELFLKYAREVVKSYARLQRAMEMAQKGTNGKLSLAFTTKYAGGCWEKQILSSFCSDYPNIDVKLINRARQEVMPAVESGEADVGLVILSGKVKQEDLDKRYYMIPVHKNRITLAVGRGHRLYHAPSEIPLSELDGESVFLPVFAEPCFARYGFCRSLEDYCSGAGIRPRFLRRNEYGGDRAIYAIKGMIVPYCSEAPINQYENIRFLTVQEPTLSVEVWMVAMRENMTPLLQTFFDYTHRRYLEEQKHMRIQLANN